MRAVHRAALFPAHTPVSRRSMSHARWDPSPSVPALQNAPTCSALPSACRANAPRRTAGDAGGRGGAGGYEVLPPAEPIVTGTRTARTTEMPHDTKPYDVLDAQAYWLREP